MKNEKFWTTIKPFMDNKGCHSNNNIFLIGNESIVNDDMQV